jgi:hypothetical protein
MIRILNIGHYESRIGLNDVFINLANNLPINIKEISFHSFTPYMILLLEKFLENCHCYLEIINLNYPIRLNLLKLILNYIKRSNGTSSLKAFGMTNSEKILKKRESKLFNQIIDNGIKIVDFYSIYEEDNNRYYN